MPTGTSVHLGKSLKLPLLVVYRQRIVHPILTVVLFSIVQSPDISGNPEGSDSQGVGTLDDHDDLSDQSEVESYSYSGPSGEALSRDPSEPLFDADFQVGPGSPDGGISQMATSKFNVSKGTPGIMCLLANQNEALTD